MDDERFTMSLRRFRQLAIVVTAGVAVLVVAGGVVRLTGSGLGCDDWPNCNSSRFVDVTSGHAAIEQVNRLLSGAIGIPTLALAIGAFRVRPRRPGLMLPALGVLVSVLANGVVGGLAVRGDLHPALVQSHFLLAMVAIAFGMLAIERASDSPLASDAVDAAPLPSAARTVIGRLSVLVAVGTALALVTGTVVTGAGPHAGDEEARRWDLDIADVARLHSVTVLVTVALALVLIAVVRRERAWSTHGPLLSAWLFAATLQGTIGYLQYWNDVPELLVGAHIAGATWLWIVTVRLVLRRGTERARADSSGVSSGVPACA